MPQLYKRLGGEVLVNTETTGFQSGSNITVLPGGGYVVVWSDGSAIGADTSGFGIKAQLFDASGSKVGSEFLVNTTTTGNQTVATIATLPSGRFVVTWIDASTTGGDTSSNAVRAQIFEANGTPVGSEFLVNTQTANSQTSPAVTELSGGGFVIIWSDSSLIGGDASGSGVKGQVFSAAGATVGGEFLVNTTVAGNQGLSGLNLIGLPSGGFAVAYGTSGVSAGVVVCSVFVQLFDAAGAKVGSEQVINADPQGNLNSVNITALNSGFVVTWAQQDSVQGVGIPVTYDLHAQLFDANGVEVGAEFIVNTTRAGTQSTADVDRLPGGGFIVTWQGLAANGTETDIFGQFFDDNGNRLGDEFLVTSLAGNQTSPKVEVLPSGEIVLLWTDSSGLGADTSSSGVKMQILVPSGLPPTDIAFATTGISEVSVENLSVGTLSSSSPGLNSNPTYTIISDSTGGAFRIEGDQLVIDNSSLLDFETRPTVEVRIRATDINGAVYEETLTLNIGDSPTEARYAAGDEILVTTDTHDTSGTSAVVALASGGFAVLTNWFDFGVGGGSHTQGRQLQILDAAGAPVGAVHDVDLGRDGGQIVLTALPSGGFVAAYEGGSVSKPGGNFYPINAQLFDAAGNAVGPEIRVSGGTATTRNPAITLLENGNFVIAWTGPDESGDPFVNGNSVVAQLFEADGDRIGGEFLLNTGVENSQDFPQLAALPDGGFVAVWGEQEAGNFRIEAQIFDAAGVKVGGEFLLLNVPVADDAIGAYHLTALANGNVLFSWSALISEEPAAYEVRTLLISPAGVVSDVLPLLPSLEPFFEVAALPGGGFAITLASPVEDGGLNHVGAALFDSARVQIGLGFEVPEGGGEASDPRIAVGESGDFIIIYGGPAGDGLSLSDTYARIFSLSDSAPPAGPTEGPDTLNGTPNADTIDGLGGDDVINGLGGDDILTGGHGDDALHGGADNDTLFELDGTNDELSGGDGNDVLTYRAGPGAFTVLLDGGAGDDVLDAQVSFNDIVTLNGGTGMDRILLNAGQTVTIDAGADADLVQIEVAFGQQITLGAGTDLLVFSDQPFQGGVVTVHDFAAGDNGDSINLIGVLISNFPSSWTNPFGTGAIQLTQEGAHAVLWIDTDAIAGSLTMAIVLENVQASSLTAHNIGYNQDGSPVSGLSLGGSAALDFLTGRSGDDLIAGNGGRDVLFGAAGNDHLQGGEGDDELFGQAGNDLLIGGSGADVMLGGVGNDTYLVEDASDEVVEAANFGSDAVYTMASYTLAAGQEIEVLDVFDRSATSALTLTGNAFGQGLVGNAGNNVLDGGGGADVHHGLGGNDVYFVDSDDIVFEAAGQGYDTVYALTSYTLAAGQEVEVLDVFDRSATAALNLTGNAFGQGLVGNAGVNVLSGAGGLDVLYGLGGNDTYFVDVDDVVFEAAGQGSDTVYATASYTLAAGSEVEVLDSFDRTSTAALNLTGNELGQGLVGNAGSNVLFGGGGADALYGLGGNDVYFADGDDVVTEFAGQGSDTVYAMTSYALAAGSEVEMLDMFDRSGTGALNLTGNALAQALVGNAGANVLDGGGGADIFYGLGGNDMFAFTTAPGEGNVDVIMDFTAGSDRIGLDDAIFAGIGGPGALDASAFVTGSAAADAGDRIIYDAATGRLFYDADGTGGIAAVQFATLNGGPALAASDFQVI